MNKTEIYYFSGTGNSFIVAQDIADRLKGSAISIPSLMNLNEIKIKTDVIGIVFPVYVGGIPRIIHRFIKKINGMHNKYIFAVCTYRNTTGATFDILRKIIKNSGEKLAGGFAVKMPGNYIVEREAIAIEEQQILFNNWKIKINEIVEYVNAKRTGKIEKFSDTNDVLGNFILSTQIFNRLLSKMNQSRDRHFYTDVKCNSCGICSKICPVNNIRIINKKPAWLHSCEHCFACLQWCPLESIQYRIHPPFRRPGGSEANMTENRSRYHNPNVKVADLLRH